MDQRKPYRQKKSGQRQETGNRKPAEGQHSGKGKPVGRKQARPEKAADRGRPRPEKPAGGEESPGKRPARGQSSRKMKPVGGGRPRPEKPAGGEESPGKRPARGQSSRKMKPAGGGRSRPERAAGDRQARPEKAAERGRPRTEKPAGGEESPGKRPARGQSPRKMKPAGGGRPRPEKAAGDRQARPEKAADRGRPRPEKVAAGRGRPRPEKTAGGEEIRLNRYIAASGICSRRDADGLITSGAITVNGKVVKELGSKVKEGDVVRYHGVRIKNERKVYLLLNKPKDYVTTTDDPKERKTVMQLVRSACTERIYPVGRLDRNSTGLLLFTNDGELARKLTHPSSNKKKVYHVFLDREVTVGDMDKLSSGLTLEDGFIRPDAISWVNNADQSEIGLEIHSGRNRIVRRMFESLGYRVNRLDRVYFAGLTKKNLPRGKWRFLTQAEIRMLKTDTYR